MIKFKTTKSNISGRTPIALPFLMLSTSLLLSSTAPAIADFTVQNGQTLTDQNVTLSTGETGTIQSGGTIQDSNNEAVTATGNVTIDNAGTLTSTAGNEDGIEHTTGTLTLFNRATGTITGNDRNGVQADVLTLTNWGAITGNDNNSVGASTITSLINSGTITGAGDGVTAALITSLFNSGTITGGGDGVDANGTLTSLINTGTITGTNSRGVDAITLTDLTNSGTINGGDEGVFATTLTSLINSGTITGGDDAVLATTITSLINTGTITGGDEAVEATGELISLINSGTITGANDGIFVVKLTSLINSGTITGNDDAVEATQLVSLVNSGTITGGNDGIFAVTLTSLINSGIINGGDGAGDDAVQATQIVSLTNSGKITGGTGVTNHAIIETGAANSLLTLLPGSDIFGKIDLGGGINTLAIGNGLSTDLTFVALPGVINSNGAPVVTNGNRVVTVDTTALAQQDDLMFDLSSGILGTVFSQLGNQVNSGDASPALSYAATSPTNSAIEANFGDDGDDNKFRMWAKLFGSHRVQQGVGASADASHNIGGLVIGLDNQIDSSMSLGAFFGASKTNVETIAKQQQSDMKSYFGGIYAGINIDNFTVHLGITGGKTDHKGTRLVDNNQINGVETAARTFDGTFFAPEIAVSSQYDVNGTTLQPTLSVGYTGVFLDGYTEIGSSAPLTVTDRNMHMLHARLELAALLGSDDSDDYSFTPYIGIEGRSLIGGNSVDATLLGQSLSFTPDGAKNIASLFAGVRLSVMQTEDFNIFAGAEASYDTEQSATIAGNFGFKWQF